MVVNHLHTRIHSNRCIQKDLGKVSAAVGLAGLAAVDLGKQVLQIA